MPSLNPTLKKAYWVLAALGGLYAIFIVCLTNPWLQRHALYAHKIHSGWWHDINSPESFGFAKNQITPFNLTTTDGETLYCWHVLPLDVYVEHEDEITLQDSGPVDDLKTTLGYKLLKQDPESRVVINFHGNAGHLAQGYRTHTYRSIASIPRTHILTCDYRGFGYSTLHNPPHIPTEAGIITDGISLVSYVLNDLSQPASRTVILGQSLGTAVAAATALYYADPEAALIPAEVASSINAHGKLKRQNFAGVILVAPFTDLPELLRTYKIGGILPVLSPLKPYPYLQRLLEKKVLDLWPTLPRLEALVKATKESKDPLRLTVIHARNDGDIPFRLGEAVFTGLQDVMRGEEGVVSGEERRSLEMTQGVRRGAFAYRWVEQGLRRVELEVVRFGGHNEVVSFAQVSLAVRRAFAGQKGPFKPDFHTE